MDNIKDIIHQVIDQMATRKTVISDDIFFLINALFEDKEKRHIKIEGIKEKKIFLIVDSPAWLYHMRMKKRKMLTAIQEKDPTITDINFKVGKVN